MKTVSSHIQTGVLYEQYFRKERSMLKFMKECAPWLNWKVGALFAAVVLVADIAFGAEAGLLAFIGATPLLAIAACMVPCLLPLAFLRGKRKTQSTTTQSAAGCTCGSDACSTGVGQDSCQSKVISVTEKHA
jgi:hypothetical protein